MKTSKILLILSIIMINMIACDKIEAPYTIEPEKPKTDKHAFLEFYTGHLDPNATASMDIIESLKSEHGDLLTIMAIHAGENAVSTSAPFDADYTSNPGNEYFSHFNILSSNNALVDRSDFDGIKVLAPEDWAANVTSQLEKEGEIKIKIIPELNESILQGSIELEFYNDIESQLSIQLYLVEDSIISAQQSDNNIIESYIHRYVLRDVLNGNWGEELAEANYTYGDDVNIDISEYSIPNSWNKSRLSIIAMVYNVESEEVLQVTEQSINFEEDNTIPERVRRVLLEDFTGQRCVNCPTAHEIAHNLQEYYGDDKLITVAVHAGFFALPIGEPYNYDFRTEAGNAYESFFGVQTYPSGMVNRINSSGNYLIDKDGWGSAADAEFQKETSLEITIKPSLSDNKISGDIDLYFFEDFGTQAYLQIYVMEDNIVKPQVTPGGDDLNYNHMHVLRGAINGDWGQLLPSTYLAEERTTISFSNYEIGDDWNTEELYIVAYVYDASTKEVLQVNKKKLN